MSCYLHKKTKSRPVLRHSQSTMDKRKGAKDYDSKDDISFNDTEHPLKSNISQYLGIIFPNQQPKYTNSNSIHIPRPNKMLTNLLHKKNKTRPLLKHSQSTMDNQKGAKDFAIMNP